MAKNKFEEMLERLINEDRTGAEELFHEIVVEKSRSIYESLLDDEDSEYDFEEAAGDDIGGDPTDDLMADLGMDDDEEGEGDFEDSDEFGDDMEGEEGEMEDRVEDLEDALDDLRAEFEKLMSDEDDMDMDSEEGDMDDEDDSMEDDFEDEMDDEDDSMDDEEEDVKKESRRTDGEEMREYVEKVAPAKMGDNGTNTKSAVAGKNDMGGTTSNIARGDTATDDKAKDTSKVDDAGNVNKPGGRASKSMKAQPKGHGAEKKGSGDNGAYTTSPIGSKKQSKR